MLEMSIGNKRKLFEENWNDQEILKLNGDFTAIEEKW